MRCVGCGSAAVTERPARTAQGYRRFRCRDCGRQFNQRSGGLLNRARYPSDVIALVVLWRLRYRLTLRDLCEMFLQRGLVFSHEAVRDWEAKLAPVLAGELRRRRRGKGGTGRRSWFVDETCCLVAEHRRDPRTRVEAEFGWELRRLQSAAGRRGRKVASTASQPASRPRAAGKPRRRGA